MKTLKLLLLLFVPLFVKAQTVDTQWVGNNRNVVQIRNAFNLPKDSIGSGNIRLKDTTLQYKVGGSWRTVNNSLSNAFLPKTFTASQTINTKGFNLDIANVDGVGNGYIYMSANEAYPTFMYLSDSVIEFGGKPTFEKLAGGYGYVVADSVGKLSKTDLGTGWASYTDTIFKTATPFAIANGTTDTLENGGQSVTLTQLPLGVTSFYNPVTKKFLANTLGDAYTISIRFKAKNSATNGYFTATFDVGGSLAFSISDTKTFAKGAGVEHSFVLDYDVFAGALWLANGGTLKITADSGNLQIYDINYLITRTHKGR